MILSLQWRHNEQDGVSTHQPHDCLLNCLFSHRSKKTSKLRVTGLCEGNSLVTGEFPTQRASNGENFSIWWCHHVKFYSNLPFPYHYMASLGQNELKYFGEPQPMSMHHPTVIHLWQQQHWAFSYQPRQAKLVLNHKSGNVFILMKFSSLAALEVVKMTTSSAASDENFIKMKACPFQCRATTLIFTNRGMLN